MREIERWKDLLGSRWSWTGDTTAAVSDPPVELERR